MYGWLPSTNSFRSIASYIENIIYFVTKQATLIRRATVLRIPFQQGFPEQVYRWHNLKYAIIVLSLASQSSLILYDVKPTVELIN
jgi:hypothetical protein